MFFVRTLPSTTLASLQYDSIARIIGCFTQIPNSAQPTSVCTRVLSSRKMLLICIYEFRIWLTPPARLARRRSHLFSQLAAPQKIFDFPFHKNSTVFAQICRVMLRYKTKAKPPHPFSPPPTVEQVSSMRWY
jgi:hypothetical protein